MGVNSSQFEIFKILVDGIFLISAFAMGYSSAMGNRNMSKPGLMMEILQSKRSLSKEIFVVFGLALLIVYIIGFRHNASVIPVAAALMAIVILVAMIQTALLVRDVLRRRATDTAEGLRKDSATVDMSAPVRWLRIGSDVLAVRADSILARRRYGLDSIQTAFGLLFVFGCIWFVKLVFFGNHWTHAPFGLTMAAAMISGAGAGGIAKACRMRCILSVRGTQVLVNDVAFGRLDEVEAVVGLYPMGYQVRLEFPGGAYPHYMIVSTTHTLGQAEKLECVVDELLENQRKSPAWAPAPDANAVSGKRR